MSSAGRTTAVMPQRMSCFMTAMHVTRARLLQVRFGVLNAGNFGVSQSRKRTFIWGVAPGSALPAWPQPLHVFRGRLIHAVDPKVIELQADGAQCEVTEHVVPSRRSSCNPMSTRSAMPNPAAAAITARTLPGEYEQ